VLAQIAIERVLNSLPEGLLIALFAEALLRILPRQNSRTRFVVWFAALLLVASLPVLVMGGFARRPMAVAWLAHAASAVSLPARWASFLLIAWALSVCMMMARLVSGLWRLHQLRQTCEPVNLSGLDPSLRSLLAELTPSNSFRSRPVTLATSERVRVPAAIGIWKPMIVLPPWALRDLPPADLAIILRHEFAHLRHWDDWTNFVQKLVRALFFFHPAVWWIENRLSVEREMACDDVVVAETANPAGYASCLVSLLERSLAERGWMMAQAIVHRARETSMRLARILDNKRPVATRISKPALGLVGAFAVLGIILLPNTPQVISFEQSAPLQAVSEHAASEPGLVSTVLPQFVPLQRAAFRTAAPDAMATSLSLNSRSGKKATATGKNQNALPSPSTVESAIAHASSTRKGDTDRAAALMASTPDFSKPDFSTPEFSLAGFTIQMTEFPVSENGTALAPAIQPSLSTIVLVRETQFLETDSSVVCRVQVWRVMLVNPIWEYKRSAPAAHST